MLVNVEKKGRRSFISIDFRLLGNNRDCQELFVNMLKYLKVMGCRMSLKAHMLHANLNSFKSNMGVYLEEKGERFHQDVIECYQGQYNRRLYLGFNQRK